MQSKLFYGSRLLPALVPETFIPAGEQRRAGICLPLTAVISRSYTKGPQRCAEKWVVFWKGRAVSGLRVLG